MASVQTGIIKLKPKIMLLLGAVALLTAPGARADSLDIVRDGKVINLVHPEPNHVYESRMGLACPRPNGTRLSFRSGVHKVWNEGA